MKHIMNILYRNTLCLACLLVLLVAGGCDSNETSPATGPVEVSLDTKALPADSEAPLSYRLLVFNKENECVENISFVPGSSSVTLAAGTYRFATLSVPEGLDIPAVGSLEEIKPDMAFGFKNNLVQAFRISPPSEIKIDQTSAAYTAALLPVTATLSLNLVDLPAGKKVTFKLLHMYTSVGLDGKTYSGEVSYPLNLAGKTACFPSNGAVVLEYTIDGGSPQTLHIGSQLAAGNQLSVNLAWSENARVFLMLSSTIKEWGTGNGEEGETGSAE